MPMSNSSDDAERQLPAAGQIFLDHVGHFIGDPDAAATALATAGFHTTPKSIQSNPDGRGGTTPTGTGNLTVMFARGYVEILFKTADTPLGREFDLALSRHPGVHLAAFSVADAGAAHARLARSGFRVRPLVDMQRPVDTETGADVAAFTIARIEAGEMPEGRMQFVTHHTEAAVWQTRWLDHPNGAMALLDMVVATADRQAAAERYGRFLDRPADTRLAGDVIRLDRGGLLLADPDMIPRLVPDLAVPALPFIGIYAIAVRSLALLQDVLARGGVAFRRHGAVVSASFPHALGSGAWLFVEHARDLPWRQPS